MAGRSGVGLERQGATMSDKLILFLLVAYVVIMGVCIYERNWPRALYWLGASILQISILWGMK